MKERHRSERPYCVKAYPIENIPLVKEGDVIAQIIDESLARSGLELQEGDVIVVATKIVSRAEGKVVYPTQYQPSQKALEIARQTGRDPRLVQAILEESREILSVIPGSPESPGIIVTRHKRIGHVCTSAGIDKSNVGIDDSEAMILLPNNPDKSAQEIAQYFFEKYQVSPGVIIVDSLGDPHRAGAIGKALGVANVPARLVSRKEVDLDGRPTKTDVAWADAVAAFAMILMGQTDQKTPVVLIRGLNYPHSPRARISDVLL